MSNRWPAGVIRKTPITPAGPYQDSAASGVWTLAEATYWKKQGQWPGTATGVTALDFTAGAVQTTDGTTQTLNLSTGSANANRYMAVVVRYRLATTGAPTSATMTIGGQSCSVAVIAPTTSGVNIAVYITDAPITNGTTANFVITAPSGYTLTSSFMSAYRIVTTGGAPTLAYSGSSATSVNPATITSPWVSGDFGIVAARASTSSSLTDLTMSASGVATQDYYSGSVENGALLTAKLIGSGDATFTTTGTGSAAQPIIAIWH